MNESNVTYENKNVENSTFTIQHSALKKGDALSLAKGYKQTEVGVIPDEWEVRSIGDFAKTSAGGTPSTKNPEFWNGSIPWMNSGELNLKNVHDVENRITELGLQNSSTKLIPKYCVLIGLAGQGKTRGTAAINHIELCTNQSIAAIYPSFECDQQFLYFFIDSQYDELRKLSTGDGGRGGLNLSIIRNIRIPLPPTLTEQRAIATALSDVDALISSLERLIAKKKAIKQGAMQELLTPPHKGGKRLAGFSGEWEETVFTKICDLVHGHQFRTEDFNHNTEGIKVVKIGNVFHNFLKTYDCDTISNNRLEEFQKYLIIKGDILMSLTGNIGRVVRVKNVYEPMLQNYRVGKFVPRDWVDGEFLAVILGSIKTTTQLEQLSNSGAQANFGKQDFDKVKVHIPKDIEEQKAIAQILSDMDVEIEALEAKKEKYKGIKQGMMQELLTGKIRLN